MGWPPGGPCPLPQEARFGKSPSLCCEWGGHTLPSLTSGLQQLWLGRVPPGPPGRGPPQSSSLQPQRGKRMTEGCGQEGAGQGGGLAGGDRTVTVHPQEAHGLGGRGASTSAWGTRWSLARPLLRVLSVASGPCCVLPKPAALGTSLSPPCPPAALAFCPTPQAGLHLHLLTPTSRPSRAQASPGSVCH